MINQFKESDNFQNTHNEMCFILNDLDKTISNLLIEKKFIHHLIKKNICYGLFYPKFNKTLFYNIEYTFFADDVDELEYRQNDVSFNIVIEFISEDQFTICLDIVSKYGDIDYEKSAEIQEIDVEQREKIKQLEKDFLEAINIFVDRSSEQ